MGRVKILQGESEYFMSLCKVLIPLRDQRRGVRNGSESLLCNTPDHVAETVIEVYEVITW